jgi:hypothetical protein
MRPPPYWRCQKPKLSTATGSAPTRSSSGVRRRPSAGALPSVRKNPIDTSPRTTGNARSTSRMTHGHAGL